MHLKNVFFQVLLLTAVSSDIAQANMKALSDARTAPSNRFQFNCYNKLGCYISIEVKNTFNRTTYAFQFQAATQKIFIHWNSTRHR